MAVKVTSDCPQCLGKGKKRYFGNKQARPCMYCGGTGKVETWITEEEFARRRKKK